MPLRERGAIAGEPVGDEEIVSSDKGILIRNGKTDGFAKGPIEEYLANGEVGVMALRRASGSPMPASRAATGSASPTTRPSSRPAGAVPWNSHTRSPSTRLKEANSGQSSWSSLSDHG